MSPKSPSRTAFGVAVHRAVHQVLEDGKIFHDPFAGPILGPGAEAFIAERAGAGYRHMRLFVAVRSRFAQDRMAEAIARGIGQVVVLGAGLDTTALRNPGLAVFEVDHPVTQEWKRRQLAGLGTTLPDGLRFVPVDFEHEDIASRLAAAGFDTARPAFFLWLGVVPYLTQEAIGAMLAYVASIPGSEIVFDYSEPPENYPSRLRKRVMALAERVAALGEPFRSHFDPPKMAALLKSNGFGEIEDLGPRGIAARYFNRHIRFGRAGGHVVWARRDR